TPVLAGTALGLQGTVGAGGRLMGGILGDKVDPRRLLTVGLFGQFVGCYFLKNAVEKFLRSRLLLALALVNWRNH
ncbi:MAG: hypothetical protein COB76_06260, partial [Alphaproteobacteria bacterium]